MANKTITRKELEKDSEKLARDFKIKANQEKQISSGYDFFERMRKKTAK